MKRENDRISPNFFICICLFHLKFRKRSSENNPNFIIILILFNNPEFIWNQFSQIQVISTSFCNLLLSIIIMYKTKTPFLECFVSLHTFLQYLKLEISLENLFWYTPNFQKIALMLLLFSVTKCRFHYRY